MKVSTAQSAFVCLIMISFKIYDKWNYSVIIILSSNSLESRQQLDRRRLEVAFMQYALLQVTSWYPSIVSLEQLHLHEGLSQTLLKTTPLFHSAIIQTYASE